MLSYRNKTLGRALLILLSSALLLLVRNAKPADNEQLPHSSPVPSATFTMRSQPTYMLDVEFLAYGSRAPLLARAVNGADGDSSNTSTAVASSHSGDGPALSPVVPALIAVTVFVVCTLVVMKSIRILRGEGVTPVYRTPAAEDEKPRLWEVQTRDTAAAPCTPVSTGGRWDQMMPIAVEHLPPYTLNSPPSSPGRPSSVSLPSPPPTARPSPSPSRDSSRASWGLFPEKFSFSPRESPVPEDPGRLRVAVLIAMPSQGSSGAPAPPAPAYLGLADV